MSAAYRWLTDWLLPRLAVALLTCALLLYVAWRWVVPAVVLSEYHRNLELHRLTEPDIDKGAGARDISYLTAAYDCRGGELEIVGRPPQADYWMMGIYDPYVRAQPGGHLNHRTVALEPDGSFRILVTDDPRGRPNTLDCSQAPQGILMYRVVYPHAPLVAPSIAVL